jgi:hypothetical protein
MFLVGESKTLVTSILKLACKENVEGMMACSAMQHQESKLVDHAPTSVVGNGGLQTQISMVSPRKGAIPDINIPCRIEENYLCKELEVMWQAKTMFVGEDFPDEYFSHESSNGQLASSYRRKIEEHCSKLSEVGLALNEKDKSTSCSQPLQEGAPQFGHGKTTSTCQKKILAGLLMIKTTDDQSKLNPKANISVRDSTSANDVDYILANNNEVNKGILS